MLQSLTGRVLTRLGGLTRVPVAGFMLVLLVPLVACREQDAAAVVSPIRPVRTQEVELTEWRQAGTAIGEIKPRYESDVGFRIAGKVAARLVEVGTVVENGTLIARLDATNEQNAIAIAETEIRSARAELEDATAQEVRQRELLRRGYATQVNYDAAQRRLKLANAKLESAELARNDALNRVGYAELRADDSGIVTAVAAQPGQVVAAGQMVVRIARTDVKEAEFRVAEHTMRSVPRNSVVEVSLLDAPTIKTTGHVREVATTADPITRSFAVRVSLETPPAQMRFGATVQGRVVLEEKQVVRLASSALVRGEGGPAVWVVDPASSTVNLRRVTVLRYEADEILVIDGLVTGERVVTKGTQKLWPGMKVRLW